MVNKYSAMDANDPLTKLRDYLRDRGLSEDDISEACEVARRDAGLAEDDPTDLAHGGEPRVGGQRLTPFRPDGSGNTKQALNPVRNERGEAMDARTLAMDACRRIQPDDSAPSQHFTATVKSSARLASDSSPRDAKVRADLAKGRAGLAAFRNSSRSMASFAARWPEVCRPSCHSRPGGQGAG